MRIPTLALMALALAPGPAGAEEVRSDLRGGPPDPGTFAVVGLEGGSVAERGPGGLTIRIPARAGGGGPAGLVLRPRLRGDFEITASYDLVKAGPPSGGHGAGVGLVVETGSADGQSLTIERLAMPGEGGRFTSTHIFADAWGEKQYRPERSGAASGSGRLRLARVGPTVEASYADGDGEFRPLRRVDLGPDDVETVRLAAYTGSADCEVVATFRDLAIRADGFPARGAGRAGGGRSGAWRARLAAAGAINLVLVLALAAWRWPGLRPRVGPMGGGRGARSAVVLGLAAVVGVSGWAHRRAIATNYVHEDERIWVACSYFYRLALRGDFESPRWGGFDGIDAPHVAHLMIGAGLRAAGEPVPEVPDGDASWGGLPLPSGARLRAARMPGALLGVATAPMVFLVAYLAASRWVAGLVAGMAYAVHPLALLCQARAMSDAPLMFFGVGSILALALALGRRRDAGGAWASPFDARGLALMVVGPALLGLAVGSKLTGAFFAATALATLGLVAARGGAARGPGRRARAVEGLAYLGLFGALTASWTVLADPTLYPDPPGRLRQMLDHRWRTGLSQRASNPEWGVYTAGDRLRAFHDRVVADGAGPAAGPLLALSAVGLGSMALGEARRARRGLPPSPALAVLAWSAVFFGGMLPTLPLNWERYYLPFLPIWAVAVGAGASSVVDAARALVGALPRARPGARPGAGPAPGGEVGP